MLATSAGENFTHGKASDNIPKCISFVNDQIEHAEREL
jgi:hypothetical protein